MSDDLIEIPLVDMRGRKAEELVTEHKAKTLHLLNASRDAFGWISRAISFIALPIGDFFSRRWLNKTQNPYRAEIFANEKIVGRKGFVALNMSYEWGCTTGAFDKPADKTGAPTLARILDWPFPALGENMVVALQEGSAGEFHNITWPGVAGMFNGVAKGRFAAALNQAPMRRYKTGILIDWVRNRFKFHQQKGLPPAHLLRKAFEEARSYEEAKAMLCSTPVALPVLYILTGTKPGEGCVIERIENEAIVREMRDGRVTVANHFESSFNGIGHGWMPRATDSHARGKHACVLPLADVSTDFAWFKEPIANQLSRLAFTADAATGSFSLIGTDGAKPVTKVFRI